MEKNKQYIKNFCQPKHIYQEVKKFEKSKLNYYLEVYRLKKAEKNQLLSQSRELTDSIYHLQRNIMEKQSKTLSLKNQIKRLEERKFDRDYHKRKQESSKKLLFKEIFIDSGEQSIDFNYQEKIENISILMLDQQQKIFGSSDKQLFAPLQQGYQV